LLEELALIHFVLIAFKLGIEIVGLVFEF